MNTVFIFKVAGRNHKSYYDEACALKYSSGNVKRHHLSTDYHCLLLLVGFYSVTTSAEEEEEDSHQA